MKRERRTLEFDTVAFMQAIRECSKGGSLREMAARVGTSAATLSRVDNGTPPDMDTFLRVCERCGLLPAAFFRWVMWRQVEEDEG